MYTNDNDEFPKLNPNAVQAHSGCRNRLMRGETTETETLESALTNMSN